MAVNGTKAKDFTLLRQTLLGENPLFAGLDREIIVRLAQYAASKRVKRGATIFRKGDLGTNMFAVCEGVVKINVPSADGKDAVFTLFGKGDIFGEIGLLDGAPRTATATAIRDCELLAIERRDFMPLLRSQPELAQRIIEVLCSRLRRTSQQVEDIVLLDVPARLAKILVNLAQPGGRAASRSIGITQRELGQLIGTSRESTNKQLREWHRRKWIRLERGKVVVVEPEALLALSEAEAAF
jgi:CRP-like cAMP-binding protein